MDLKIWDFVSRLFKTLLFILLEKQGNVGTGTFIMANTVLCPVPRALHINTFHII